MVEKFSFFFQYPAKEIPQDWRPGKLGIKIYMTQDTRHKYSLVIFTHGLTLLKKLENSNIFAAKPFTTKKLSEGNSTTFNIHKSGKSYTFLQLLYILGFNRKMTFQSSWTCQDSNFPSNLWHTICADVSKTFKRRKSNFYIKYSLYLFHIFQWTH